MHTTLGSLIERALKGNQRPLEFYLLRNSHLPGPRANVELANRLSRLLAVSVLEHPENVRALLQYFIQNDRTEIMTNTPEEFVIFCGVVALGACAATQPSLRGETFELLSAYASHSSWRLREGAAIAFHHLVITAPQETIRYLTTLATVGSFFQQRAAIVAVAESPLGTNDFLNAALTLQRIILERLHSAPVADRKLEDFRALRQALGYTISVITAMTPEKGFALMRDCATWGDADITWILRENLKKKRLAGFVTDTEVLFRLLA